MTQLQKIVKRSFDFSMALLGLLVFGWLIVICWILATIDTRKNGFFIQRRIGRHGKVFSVIKIRSMRAVAGVTTTVTTEHDPRISPIGGFFRKTKLDELPQLINVLIGKMSFVGPRPDVPGYADKLERGDRKMLELRPGITGPASLYYRDEEELLARQQDPEEYNITVLWPAKVKINLSYINEYSFWNDIRLIVVTVTGIGFSQFKEDIEIQNPNLNAI